jgi:hypothetical protein
MHAIQIVWPYFIFHYLPLGPSTFSQKRWMMPKHILARCNAYFGFAMDIRCHYHLHPSPRYEKGVGDQRVE